MSVFFQRFILLLFLVVLQYSFFDILWPGNKAPSVVVATVIAIIFLHGFERGMSWVLLVIGVSFIIGGVNIIPVLLVGIAYGTSFLSRRMRIEHRVQNMFVLSFVSGVSTLVLTAALQLPWLTPIVFTQMLGNAMLTGLVFPFIYSVIRWSEEQIETRQRSEFRSVRF